jgi:hypothetical protein
VDPGLKKLDTEGSFLKEYVPFTCYLEGEPRAPHDIPILEEDFKGREDHDARWWGVRHTAFDRAEGIPPRPVRGTVVVPSMGHGVMENKKDVYMVIH